MLQTIKNFYLTERFFYYALGIVGICILAFWWEPLLWLGGAYAFGFLSLVIVEIITLYQDKNLLEGTRKTPNLMSLGSENELSIVVQNLTQKRLYINLTDEVPEQFQYRNAFFNFELAPDEKKELFYELRPFDRGVYQFGIIRVFVSSKYGFVQRRINTGAEEETKVYPSILEMKEMEIKAFSSATQVNAFRKIPRSGLNQELEQIREYTIGDDYRHINWKSTGRHSKLMVNQYQEERAQHVYCLLEKSFSMEAPFDNMTILDYAVNTSLALSNIAIKKHDKPGVISFSSGIGTALKASNSTRQLKLILEGLYQEQNIFKDADYDLLYRAVNKLTYKRSLLWLFCHFETMEMLYRRLPVLQKLAKKHLLVVVLFQNTGVVEKVKMNIHDSNGLFEQVIARKWLSEQKAMQRILHKEGIQTLVTTPKDLTANSVNKYLSLKRQGRF